MENRKGAAKPRPLCTPLGLFLGVLGCGGGEGVGLCLYASVLGVGRCADLVPVCFGIGGGALCRVIFLGIRPAALLVMDCFEAVFCMLRYWMRNTVPIWFLYASVLDVERCADLFLYIVFFWHWAGCTFASILCSLRLNFQPGMWQRYGLLRRRCDTA